MIARGIPKTGPRRCRLLYVEDHADSVVLVDKLLAGRKDLLLLHAADAKPESSWRARSGRMRS